MKILLLIILALLPLQAVLAQGQTGVGAMLGWPTGVTAKRFMDSGHAVDAALGWMPSGGTPFQIHGDWLWNKSDALYFKDSQPLDLYFGAGGRLQFADDIHLGVRVPVGLSYWFNDRSGEAFSEFAPVLDVAPKLRAEANLAIGFRVYF